MMSPVLIKKFRNVLSKCNAISKNFSRKSSLQESLVFFITLNKTTFFNPFKIIIKIVNRTQSIIILIPGAYVRCIHRRGCNWSIG